MNNHTENMCIYCKYAFLDKTERVFHRVSGKEFLFDCLAQTTKPLVPISKYANECTNYQNISQNKNSCTHYKPCPE